MALKKNNISFASTSQFSRLFMDYVSGNPVLRDLYTYSPDLSSFKQAIADRSSKELNRELLSSVLKDQYTNVADSKLQLTQIEKLKSKNTFTVCTGHQLCLFTGPLYFIYKIITTINLAETLKKTYPDSEFIPVYWMASEDHDIEEIRHIHLFGKTLSWNDPSAKGPAGRLNTSSIEPLIDELAALLGDSSHSKELIGQFFGPAYLNNKDLASATRQLVHSLFGKYGLLILDGDDARLKTEFLDIIKDDISNNTNYKLVEASAAELKKKGYNVQVNPREINVFLLEENDRTRIEKATEANLKLSSEKYSPNVVLRPLYQQKILPNLAYVGGPGEIAYWLEYKKMFDHHGIQLPVLMPRNFALLTDEKTSALMSKLGLKQEDLFRDTDELVKEFVSKNAEADLSLEKEAKELQKVFEGIMAKTIDPGLKASVEAELQKTLNSLKNIETKLLRAEKQKQETGVNQIKKMKEKFLPGGVLQERHENFSSYYAKTGQQFIDDLKQNFEPFEFNLMILE